ncbi:hypothetical protein Bbelb_031660 [Branchiostoma belcheri]|nr:hypothetical protein Bbelb_031660 [Branchiostoma belcheri]
MDLEAMVPGAGVTTPTACLIDIPLPGNINLDNKAFRSLVQAPPQNGRNVYRLIDPDLTICEDTMVGPTRCYGDRKRRHRLPLATAPPVRRALLESFAVTLLGHSTVPQPAVIMDVEGSWLLTPNVTHLLR